ncbi:MAG: MGH1-like glycoside hydrolase domain-containing protein [Salinispira sp.]
MKQMEQAISEQLMDRLIEKSRAILHKNDAGGFTVPTRNGLYPAQWNWDSAFVSLAFAYVGEADRGWQEIEMLLNAQWPNGMVPHIVFHIDDSGYFPNSQVWQAGEAVPSSGISQPPVLATFVRRIIEREDCTPDDWEKLREVFPKLLNYHRWYHETRNYRGMVKIIHPWESGFDNNQTYDKALYNVPLDDLEPYQRQDIRHAGADQRPHNSDYDHYIALVQFFRSLNYDARRCSAESPFQLTDIGVNSMLLRADRDLLALARMLGHPTDELEKWIQVLSAALEECWSSELSMYIPYDVCANTSVSMPSINGMLPLFGLESMQPERLEALCSVIIRWMESVKYGLPCFDPDDDRFEPYRYCRGPAWPVWSWLVAQGLRQHGKHELASHIREKTLELLNTFDFYEFFDPQRGIGGGGSSFSWSAAMTVLFLREMTAGGS